MDTITIEHIRKDSSIVIIDDCADSNHPDFMGVVHVKYCGPIKHEDRIWYIGDGTTEPMNESDVANVENEVHALIYTDGTIAVTLYECCYAVFYLKTGKVMFGNLWEKNEWELSKDSLNKIRELVNKKGLNNV